MIVYLDLVFLLNFLVDFLLILAVNRYCGVPASKGRAAAGGALGGVYGAVCLLPGFSFLGGSFWRIAALVAVGAVSFGLRRSAVRKTLIFALLNMTLGGMVLLFNAGNLLAVIVCACLLGIFCIFAKRQKRGALAFVELRMGEMHRTLLALRDTGNSLCDPLTGMQVLVAGADIAREMFGLTAEQLRQPAETLMHLQLRGARLVPFNTIDKNGGLLLAVNMDAVTIDGEKAGTLVAFSPLRIGSGADYEALTGGNL